MQNKTFVLVPYWADEALRRAKQPVSGLLDFSKARQLYSTNDLAQILVLQPDLGNLADIQPGMEPATTLISHWYSVRCPEDRAFLDNTVVPISMNGETTREARTRLFDPSVRRERDTCAFNTYDITPQVGAVVIYPGWFQLGVQTSLQLELIEAVLKAFYVFQTHTEVASSPWFKQYLQTLLREAVAS